MGRTRARTEPATTRVLPWSRSARTGVSAPTASAAPSADAARTPSVPVAVEAARDNLPESPGRPRDSASAPGGDGSQRSAPDVPPEPPPTPVTGIGSEADDRFRAGRAGSNSGTTESGAAQRVRGGSATPGSGAADRLRRRRSRGVRTRRRDTDSRVGRVARDVAGAFAREGFAQRGVAAERPDRAARMPETLREAGEYALHAVRKWADPRERELRKRRRVRRRSLRWSAASGMTVLGTAGLVAISAPAWAVIVVGSGTVALATGAAVSTRRYLDMRRNPLPPVAFVPRRLPSVRSAARAPIARLVRAERAMYELGRHIAQGGRVPSDDLTDTLATADSGAAALHALAGDVVAMEQAIAVVASSQCGPQLSRQLEAMVERLESGVVEYEQLVSAAGRILAVPAATGAAPADEFGWAMFTLREAADRLDGWAQALTDLADRR
ncbi:phage shock envelope stress response protein PspM [Nocardia spumae]|uniref:phage shock envelope stress response protein PspM n=1 Tax=Nocardia spumae TaxID=2887190 RepID=UPI001D152706|nr:hypothetical protein [Nocardia spumae]